MGYCHEANSCFQGGVGWKGFCFIILFARLFCVGTDRNTGTILILKNYNQNLIVMVL